MNNSSSCASETEDSEVPTDASLQRKRKSVSFHSATSLSAEKQIISVEECLKYIINGSPLMKVRPNGRQFHRFYSLSEDMTHLKWTPTSKKGDKAILPVCDIREIRSGKSLLARHNCSEECSFTLLLDEPCDTLHLVAPTPEETNIWVTALNALLSDALDSTCDIDVTSCNQVRERWLASMFQKAAQNDSYLDETETVSLLMELAGDETDEERIRQKLLELEKQRHKNGERGRIDSSDFVDVFKEIATRPEIYFLLMRFSNKDFLTIEDLQLFLEEEQGTTSPSIEVCGQIIDEFEPSSEGKQKKQLLVDGFTKFLSSPECHICNPSDGVLCQDMNQPLSHYFISSSHNTSVNADGTCSANGYEDALRKGCRCVKVQCSSGSDGPFVSHGDQPGIPFLDVISTIKSSAFISSKFPVILLIETKCTVSDQKKMAVVLSDIIGDALYYPTSLDSFYCSTPNELKEKIIILGWHPDAPVLNDKANDGESTDGLLKKQSPILEITNILNLKAKFTQSSQQTTDKGSSLYSMEESEASQVAHNMYDELVTETKTHLVHVYPNTSRSYCSNFNPQDFWNCGCQLVSMNYCNRGAMMDLQDGRFQQNGGCGYVLKPGILREPFAFFSKDGYPGVAQQVLRVKIISGQHLPRPKGSIAKGNSVDPYVIVQIYGIPADTAERRTRTVSNEGDCPIFDESFEFIVVLPQIALIRFAVMDDDYIGDDFIGQFTCPFESIQAGYRNVRLKDQNGEYLENSSIFVHISYTNKQGGGRHHRNSSIKLNKLYIDIRQTGLKNIDELFKIAIPIVTEATRLRADAINAFESLRADCELPENGSVRQCLRAIAIKLAACQEVKTFNIKNCNKFPTLDFQASSALPQNVQKTVDCLEWFLKAIQAVLENSGNLEEQIQSSISASMSHYGNIEKDEIHCKKHSRLLESFAWNMRYLRGQLDLLRTCKKEQTLLLHQIQNYGPSLDIAANRERGRERERRLSGLLHPDSSSRFGSLQRRRSSWDPLPPPPTALLSRSPTLPLPPKSILKKKSADEKPQGNANENTETEFTSL